MSVYWIVLLAAVLHASWNAIVKGGSDKLLSTALVACTAAILGALALPFLAQPGRESWPFIAVSVVLQVAYYALVARIYEMSDMGQAYPVMRGTAPLLVAFLSLFLLDDPLSGMALIGIVVICVGIFCMGAWRHKGSRAGLALALLNAGLIAAYTLVDGIGVRRSDSPIAYTLWIFLLAGVAMGVWVMLSRQSAFMRYARVNWQPGLMGGFGAIASYGMALWAMTLAPVAVIAALRETSILFGVLIAGFVLKEPMTSARTIGASVIVLGAAALRLA